jgi:flagellar biosynthesis/type III secretory pathway ATPase
MEWEKVLFWADCSLCQSDVNVIALVGERGREVKEFIEKD